MTCATLKPELSQSPIFTIPRKRFVLRCDGWRDLRVIEICLP